MELRLQLVAADRAKGGPPPRWSPKAPTMSFVSVSASRGLGVDLAVAML